MGRKPIHDKAMTPAQRKARSRALALGAVAGELAQAARLAAHWHQCMKKGRPAATDEDITAAFAELAALITSAELHIPRS